MHFKRYYTAIVLLKSTFLFNNILKQFNLQRNLSYSKKQFLHFKKSSEVNITTAELLKS